MSKMNEYQIYYRYIGNKREWIIKTPSRMPAKKYKKLIVTPEVFKELIDYLVRHGYFFKEMDAKNCIPWLANNIDWYNHYNSDRIDYDVVKTFIINGLDINIKRDHIKHNHPDLELNSVHFIKLKDKSNVIIKSDGIVHSDNPLDKKILIKALNLIIE